MKDLLTNGVKVHILNSSLLDNTPASKLVRTIFFAFAEFVHDMIVERKQEGKAIARLKTGYKEGRPKKYSTKQINHALQLLKTHSYKEAEKIPGISKCTLIRAKKDK